jgi:hypothetical protein
MSCEVKRDEITVATYVAIVTTFMVGYIRFLEAQLASEQLVGALLKFRTQPSRNIVGNEFEAVLDNIRSVKRRAFQSFEYVTDISHLVYATSLLDTFLTETMIFLFMLVPDAMGKNQQVPLRTLIDATSRSSVLKQAAIARAREISYKSFEDRLDFLRSAFGVEIKLDDSTKADLILYTSIRNTAVHDQGVFALHLEDSGSINHSQKACHIHPTQLPEYAPSKAAKAYEKICLVVATDVLMHVLKADPNGIVAQLQDSINSNSTSWPSTSRIAATTSSIE